jgi:hypothetical protein
VKRFQTPTDNPILAAYFGEPVSAEALASEIRALHLEGEALGVYSELDAAVAAVLLRSVRHELPQWALVKNGDVTLGRKKHRSKKSGFAPRHLYGSSSFISMVCCAGASGLATALCVPRALPAEQAMTLVASERGRRLSSSSRSSSSLGSPGPFARATEAAFHEVHVDRYRARASFKANVDAPRAGRISLESMWAARYRLGYARGAPGDLRS